jgi:hypothetical protein
MTEAERATSMAGAAAETANKLISTLPAQFLVLVLMNTIFILGMLWFLERTDETRATLEQHQAEARERVVAPLLAACLKKAE